MPEIFDLSKIKRLVEEKRPPAILIVDTNVLMNETDFSKWGTSIGKPIFVLSDMIMVELEYIKTKPEPREKAIKAIKSVNNLFKQGKITEGIVIEHVGSFISVPAPKADQLNPELEQLDDIVKAFKRTDAKFLLLTRECNRFIPNIPTLFVTGEYNLFNIMEANGIPSYMFESFPMSGIEEVIKKSLRKPIDWDNVLADIQTTTKGKSVEVELTLTSKKCMPKWLQGVGEYSQILLAEGYGIIHSRKDDEVRFLWSLPFKEYSLQLASGVDEPKAPSTKPLDDYLNKANLDFLGYEQQISEQLIEALRQKIGDCTSPVAYIEDMPTVQGPLSVIQMLLLFDYLSKQEELRNSVSSSALNKLQDEIREAEGLVNFWVEWILDDQENDEDKYIVLGELLNAISSCWSIGNTVKLTIISDQKLNQD